MSFMLYLYHKSQNHTTGLDIQQSGTVLTNDTLLCMVYNVILPTICFFGLIGNSLSFFVLLRMMCTCSSYTYLIVLTVSDWVQCLLILISTVVNQIFNKNDGDNFDLLITLPIAAIFSGISVCATVGVTLDRMLAVRNADRKKAAPFCRQEVARRIMAIAIFIVVIFNLPFFFIYQVNEDYNATRTLLFQSRFYIIYNWVRFTVFGLIPAILLPIMTGVLIHSLKHVRNQLRHLSCKRKTEMLAYTRMTITLISLVFFFLLGEIPGHIISKKAAFVFLYAGDPDMIGSDDLLIFRQVALILGALNCSVDFWLYFFLHPPFGKGLAKLFSKSKKPIVLENHVEINVFFIFDETYVKKVTKVMPMFSDLVSLAVR